MDISDLNKKELSELIKNPPDNLHTEALRIKRKFYGNKIFARGLIEITSYCKNNCFYCGIRAENTKAVRYRLSKEEILECSKRGAELGFSTFVLQGGEDLHFTTEQVCDIVYSIKNLYPNKAITLSLGEKSREEYRSYKSAGADRYLLRHETANDEHYRMLHPNTMRLSERKKCLYTLKELGYQTGAGFMVGSPYQTTEALAEDLLFLKELQPEMVGIGPFIPHCDTPFGEFDSGDIELTLTMLSLTRLLLPKVLLPSTTALATLDSENGRRRGFMAGANVVMPNLTPKKQRENYLLYNNKISSGNEDAAEIEHLKDEISSIGDMLDMSRGDHCSFN